MRIPNGLRPKTITISGIVVKLQWTWFVFMAGSVLIIGGLHLPASVPNRSWWAYGATGVIITCIIALSLLLHELSHSLVAIRAGVPVPEITMHLFGGLSRIQTEARTPRDDAWIAAAGPLCSAIFALGFVAATMWMPLPRPSLRWFVLAYGSYINIILVLFNLVPGMPLDGGRILRAFLWWKTGSINQGTRIAAGIGRFLGYGIILWGIYQMFQRMYIPGSFNVVIGLFMRNAAGMTVDFTFLDTALRTYKVQDAMMKSVVMVQPKETIQNVISKYFLHYGNRAFLVGNGEKAIGMITASDVKDALDEGLGDAPVMSRMQTNLSPYFVDQSKLMLDVYHEMQNNKYQRMFVGSPSNVLGVVSHAGIMRYSEMLKYLEIPLQQDSAQR